MSRWFRHYAGMMRDEKLVRVAIKSKQPIERVLWVWGAILESAAEIDDNGRYDLDAAEVAYFLRTDEDDVGAILASLADAGRLAGAVVVNWGDRQFSSDRSKDRQAAYRERKKTEKRGSDSSGGEENARVTSPSRHDDDEVTAQETETETEITPKETIVSLPPKGARRTRGSRIDPDWQPPAVPELPPEARALAEQWTPASYKTEAAAFVAYWLGESGANASKLDWGPAWQNRIVQIHSKVMRDQKYGNSAPEPAKTVTVDAASLDRKAALFRKMGQDEDAADCERRAARMRKGGGTATIGSIVAGLSP